MLHYDQNTPDYTPRYALAIQDTLSFHLLNIPYTSQ